MKYKSIVLLGNLFLAIASFTVVPVFAACTSYLSSAPGTNANYAFTENCDNTSANTFTNSSILSGPGADTPGKTSTNIYNSGSTEITNSSTISTSVSSSSNVYAIVNGGANLSITNAAGATISSQNLSSTASYAVYNLNASTISLFDNYGLVTADKASLINSGTITRLLNEATGEFTARNITPSLNASVGIDNSNVITTLDNYGLINSLTPTRGIGIKNSGGSITTFTNYAGGVVTGAAVNASVPLAGGIINSGGGANITTLNNAGTINGGIGNFNGAITTLNNTGIINSDIVNGQNAGWGSAGTIGTLLNSGTINGQIANYDDGVGGVSQITTLTNTGTITNGVANILTGSITNLNNSQGAGNAAGALTYSGKLPTNYNIIINGPSSFGKLAVTSGSGSTNFGIYAGSTVANGTYAAVLSGLSAGNLTATTGTFGAGTWTLSNSSGSIWDLIFSGYYSGPSAANTQQSLVNTAQALQGTYTLQNSVLTNSFSYDCNLFDVNNICISAGGRNTAVSAANGLNNTSALLIAAYRVMPSVRVGAYADQNLSVNNGGSTVSLGNNTPLIGLFGAWNERLDGTGTEVKVSAAYGQKNTTVNRSVVGSGATASEAGSGSSALNSQGAQVIAKYGFGIADQIIISPYIGLRYTQNNMGGYTEGASATVTAPLTYSALNTNATTALVGVGASYKLIPTVTTFASAGVETDTNTTNGTYSATSVTGLTPVNFNPNPVRTRPTATLGAYYDIVKNQRLGVTGIYRQEAYQAVSTTTVMATYTVGL